MHIGEVYLDAITGTYMVGVSAKVSDKTVLSADISIDEVARETNSITILDSGYAMLIEKNTGFVIAHPDDKIAGTTIAENGDVFLSDIYANINNMDTLFPITYDGQKYFVIMEEIKGTDWILIGCAPYSCVMGQLSNLQVMITFMVVIALLILIMVSVLLIRQATKPIHELTESIEVITSGDFTKEVRTSGNNEITTTEEALKKFIARMRDVIRDVSDVSNKLADDADNSKKASQNIYDSVGKQTCSVKQLNEAVDEVGRSIEDLATNATSLAMVVSEVSEDGTKASADMQNAYELAEEGRRDIQKVADKMEEILSAITNLKQTVSEVGKSTKEINQITDVIGDISSQTNLLALNASIEAARAGEAGKGFAVVATEIGNLANMSASAVTKIADMINQMDLDMKQCIEQTDITEKDIDESGNYVKKTYETFGQIYDKIEVTTGLIEKMTKKIQTVDEVAANMAATTEEQSAKTQEMMDTAQDLYQHSVTIENNSADIRTLSEEVSGFADKVKERLDVFEI